MMAYALLYKDKLKSLYIPYLPYERADRQVLDKLPTVNAMVDIINLCGFKSVKILDAHNDVPLQSIENVQFVFPYTEWSEIAKKHNINTICFPYDGAKNRYKHCIDDTKNIVTATKKRDLDTGIILSLELDNKINKGEKVLIIDDLCSKGGTFVLTANKLKEAGASEVYLFTSHCERTVYDGDLIKSGSPITKFYTLAPFLHGNDILEIL